MAICIERANTHSYGTHTLNKLYLYYIYLLEWERLLRINSSSFIWHVIPAGRLCVSMRLWVSAEWLVAAHAEERRGNCGLLG